MKKTIIMAAAMTLAIAAQLNAQHLTGKIAFDFKFDNREYDNIKNGISETHFSVRLTPQTGISWNDGNLLMIGIDMLDHLGAETRLSPQMICYYSWSDNNYGIFLGRFPRRNLVGRYSDAFFSDYVTYYDSNLDGLMAHYSGSRGYAELVFDWDSMMSASAREKFMIFSSGQISYGTFYCGYNASMYHHAGSEQVRGVVDNILIYPYAGADFAHNVSGFRAFYVQAGWLQAFQNDRNYIGHYVMPGGIQIDMRIQKRGFGLYNALYLGGNIMPYYYSTMDGQPDYGASLYKGDMFYGTDSGMYERLEIYWHHEFKSGISVTVSSVQHYNGTGWGWQQKLDVKLLLSDNLFRFPKPYSTEN